MLSSSGITSSCLAVGSAATDYVSEIGTVLLGQGLVSIYAMETVGYHNLDGDRSLEGLLPRCADCLQFRVLLPGVFEELILGNIESKL